VSEPLPNPYRQDSSKDGPDEDQSRFEGIADRPISLDEIAPLE